MKIFAIVPAKKFENAKTRLSPMLMPDERIDLSFIMLSNTLKILSNSQAVTKVIVVSADRRAEEVARGHGAIFLDEEIEAGVNSAVAIADKYCIKQGADATLVIPQDIPLLDTEDIMMACDLAKNDDNCIVICPSSRYDGTSLLLRKPPTIIKTYYDSDSYQAHVESARELGIPVKLFFSKKLMHDIDTPEDARELVTRAPIDENKIAEFLYDKVLRLSS